MISPGGSPAAPANDRASLEAEILRRRLAKPVAANAVVRRPPGEPRTVSLAQRRLWLLDQMTPGSSAYNSSVTLRVKGALRPELLRRALDDIVGRHEILRTVLYPGPTGLPEAALLEGVGVAWRELDLTHDQGAVDGILAVAANQPFDMAKDVMLRALLVKLGPDHHIVMLNTHHIVMDGWSRGILFSELSALYRAHCQGGAQPLPELPVQYADFARWQENWFNAERLQQEADFWRDQLDGADVVTELPTDRPRPQEPSSRGARLGLEVVEEVAAGLRNLGREEQATVFMVLMAATGLLVSAITGQDDLVLGSPVANRLRPEVEHLIGFFVNTVVFRVRMEGDPTFRELVRRCRATAFDCLSHQELPFDKLVELLRPRRHPGRNPLFQVNYRLQGAPPALPSLDGAITTRVDTDFGASRFDLGIGFVDVPGPLRGYLEYNPDLFERATIATWARAAEEILLAAAAKPDARLSSLVGQARDLMEEIDG